MTPHLPVGKTPAEMIFQNRLIGTRIPDLIDHINASSQTDKLVREKDATAKGTSKHCAEKQFNTKSFAVIAGNQVIVKKPQESKT